MPCPYNQPCDTSSHRDSKQSQILLPRQWRCSYSWDPGQTWQDWTSSSNMCEGISELLNYSTSWHQIRHDHLHNARHYSKRSKSSRTNQHCNSLSTWKFVGAQHMLCWIGQRLNKMYVSFYLPLNVIFIKLYSSAAMNLYMHFEGRKQTLRSSAN